MPRDPGEVETAALTPGPTLECDSGAGPGCALAAQALSALQPAASGASTLVLNRPDVVAIVEDLTWYLGEPFGDTSAIPTYMVSKLAAAHVKVVLTGDGGDEVFAGYERYAVEARERSLDTIPAPLRHTAGAVTVGLALLFVVGSLVQLVPGALGEWLTKLMPGNAGSAIANVESFNPMLLDPWVGFAVFCGETLLLLAVAGWLFARRDA